MIFWSKSPKEGLSTGGYQRRHSIVCERRHITWSYLWNCHDKRTIRFHFYFIYVYTTQKLQRPIPKIDKNFSGWLWNPDSGPQFWGVRATPRSLLFALLTWFWWSLERNLRGSTGLCGFCGFNKWNFETSKSTFDIQFIIFRFWNEGLGERSSSSFTYVLSLQLDSHGFFVGFFAISQFKNFALKPEKFILTMNYSRRTKSSDDFAICESVWCLVCSAHDKNNKI